MCVYLELRTRKYPHDRYISRVWERDEERALLQGLARAVMEAG